jgi:NAD(P)-dependent dehydrogenase (short-subunit alcohol dehydrogenase family)
MSSVFITGANRGLGLEFARQYAAEEWRVYAACRDPQKADQLKEVVGNSNGRVTVHTLDVTRLEQFDALANELKDQPIDILLSNAGIYNDHGMRFGTTDYNAWMEAFRINSMATLKLAEAFVEQVARSEKKIIVTITSKMGSIADNTSGGSYLYRTSKAAVNAVVKSLSYDLKPRGIISVVLNPGWVQTDMGGKQAPLTVEQSIAALRKIISKLTIADSGKFYHYDGQEVLW